MTSAVASAPGKVILFGEHGIHRGQASITTAVELRVSCRVSLRADDTYCFRTGAQQEQVTRAELMSFKSHVDQLRESGAVTDVGALARDFFVPARYVMSQLVSRYGGPGLDVEWASNLPVGSGLGSGAAAFTSLVVAATTAMGVETTPEDRILLAWHGDIIAHGGYGSSLDSSTCIYGGFLSYTLADKAKRLPFDVKLPLVIGDTLVEHSTSRVNTHINAWLAELPSRVHIFNDMSFLVQEFMSALGRANLATLGKLMNIHQLLQEKMGTSCAESEALVEAALGAGALGAKISGSGCGGIIIALAQPGQQEQVAAAIDAAGGKSYVVQTGAQGAHIERQEAPRPVAV